MVATTLPGVLLTGIHSARPAANAVGTGALYSCSTHSLVYQSDGSTWSTWANVAGTGFANPMTTSQDIIVGGSSGTPGRLAKGSDGQVLTVDPSTHNLLWATPASGFANPMTTKGDVIVADTGGTALRLAVGSDGQVLTADAASTGGIKWAAGGGGGATHSYIGYNTAGSSHAGMVQYRIYLTKVTIASAGLISSVGAYIGEAGTHVGSLSVGVYADAAGTPAHFLARNSNPPTSMIPTDAGGGTSVAEWVHVPIGLWVAAADYWLAVQDVSPNPLELYYNTSGSDLRFTPSGAWFTNASSTVSDSLHYSIRADLLS